MSQYLSFVGWAFLPSLATSWIQSIYYGLVIRAGDPKPASGSPRFESDRRKIHILVVSVYLAYTIFEADYDIRRTPSYYQELGLPFDASDRDIKSRYRRVAALHHPDKTGAAAEDPAYFIHLKEASDALLDGAKRFAYERFGPDVVHWGKCTLIKDYLAMGVTTSIIPHYVVVAGAMYVMSVFKYMNVGAYYRWIILAALFTFEIHTITRPGFPALLNGINGVLTTFTTHAPLLPFQLIAMARKITATLFIALNQIAPLVLKQAGLKDRRPKEDEAALREALGRMEQAAQMLDTDASRLMDMEMAPFKGDASATWNLQGKMKEWLVQNTIHADPMVRDSMGTALRRRTANVPAGARGNR